MSKVESKSGNEDREIKVRKGFQADRGTHKGSDRAEHRDGQMECIGQMDRAHEQTEEQEKDRDRQAGAWTDGWAYKGAKTVHGWTSGHKDAQVDRWGMQMDRLA